MKTKHTKGEWEIMPLRENSERFNICAKEDVKNENGKRLILASCLFEKAWEDPFIQGNGRSKEEVRRSEEEALANAKLIIASPELLNSALLDNCFPMMTEKDKEKTFELAKSFGWEMDEPVEIFAMKLRNAAIKKAIK